MQQTRVIDAAEEKSWRQIKLYEFFDNDQFSNLDCFLNQVGKVVLYLSDEFDKKGRGDSRKVHAIATSRDLEIQFMNKVAFAKKSETASDLVRLVGRTSHTTNSMESEMPAALGCAGLLVKVLGLLNIDREAEKMAFDVSYGALDNCMRLDSAAAEAVNLLPKPDHPSAFGSLYGILNRCRTKLGSRLLERWLRQPLLDSEEINARLDVVEAFFGSTVHRNEIREGALKAVPDLDVVMARMNKPNAGLEEVFKLYLFVRSIPSLTHTVQDLGMGGQGAITSASRTASILSEKYLQPLRSIAEKFTLYEQLVEHVVDMGSLPELKVNHQHDQELGEIAEKQQELQVKAERILHEARSTWGSFADVKMEQNGKDGFILRTTRGDDERQLRANCSSVKVLSILKNGVHFTTTALEKLADRYLSLEAEYEEKQSTLVTQALDTARTYLPVVEAVANLIAELDVLASFATAAALSPGVYVRPIAEKGVGGSIDLRGARHPCVELMDGVQQFIANDYDLIRGKSTFQIVTGPNMGGKSTYIRAVGCIVVLAQIGMYVPCDSAELSVSDCILARVGAGDAVQKGVSTFMAEMLESSVMLQTASSDSLIIIDELGRGTSTFDGFGLAWSISDYIVKQLRCKCLFATHFHGEPCTFSMCLALLPYCPYCPH
ncbi:muts domain V-domain-containing protein [Ochromonadaceae sp. CCMP2298]|nr:muts domain V-domain-containing protein [Ochromonadaceae sp. CCMP2298]